MSSIRIRIFSGFCDSRQAKKYIDKIAYYNGDKIEITDNDEYTHVIIWNTAMPNIREGIPKENVIGFAHEPLVYLRLTQQFINYATKYIHKYYIGDVYNLSAPFVEKNGYLLYNMKLKELKPKNNRMSIIISQKLHQEGHKYRHVLANAILKTDLPIDIYGRGCGFDVYDQSDTRLKGIFERYEPYDGYSFHICIENVGSNHYFSEKIINPLLMNVVPVYLGCVNIEKYFPNNIVKLTGNVNNDMLLITDIMNNPDKYKKNIDIDEIDKKVSLKHNVEELFE